MDDQEIIKALVIGLTIAGILYIFAMMKKGSSKMRKPNRLLSFTTKTSIEIAMKTIIQFAQANGYKIDDFNEHESIIVLSDTTTLLSMGFVYLIYLSKPSGEFTLGHL